MDRRSLRIGGERAGGERQRVAIARALAPRPLCVLADEPTGNVDPEIGARLLRLFAEMNRMGATVLIATHDVGLIETVSARTLTLHEGQLSEDRSRRAS